MPNNEHTTSFKVDISELKKGIQDANREIRLANAEFKAASSGMEDWGNSADGLSAKIKQLETVLTAENKKLESLEKQLEATEKEYGSNSSAADELRIKIANQQATINKTERSLNDYKSQLENVEKGLDDVGEAAKDADGETQSLGDGFTVLKGTMASLIADGVKSLISGLISLVEETKEYRNEMAKLETAFASGGFSAETAKKTYQDFYAVLGDEGQATEAVSFLAKMVDNEKDLATWTDIATGIYAEFGASLPIEGLTEAANETAKVGQVTGGLADALNWVGISEDEFNEKLAKCSDEQERQKLIMDTLNGVYSDSATKFRENNAEVIAANEANANLADAQAQLGETIAPLTTAWTQLKTGALQWLIDTGLPGLKTGWNWVLDNIPVVATIVTGLTAAWLAFGGVQTIVTTATTLMTAAQTALNIAMNANPIGLVVLAITALVAGFMLLWKNCDGFRNFFINMWEGIQNIVGTVVDWIKENWKTMLLFLMNPLAGVFKYCYDHFEGFRNFVDGIVGKVKGFFIGLWDWVKENWQAILLFLINPFAGLFKYCYDNFEGFRNFIDNMVESIKGFFLGIINWVKDNWQSILLFLVNPFAGLFKYCYDNFEGFRNFINGIVENIKQFFTDLWEKLKNGAKAAWEFLVNVFKGASNWYKEKVIQPTINFFLNLWDTIKNAAKNAWDFIVNVFKNAANWYNEKVVQPVKNFFTGMWDGLKNGAKNAWEGVKETFSKVATFFKDTFTNAWQKVKDVFSTGGKIFDGIKEGIVTSFKTVVNAIIRGINKVVKLPFEGLNGILNKLMGLSIAGINPFSWLTWRAPIPQLPELFKGGVLKRGQVGLLEGNGAEAVVPLENNAAWIRKTAKDLKRQLVVDGVIGGGNNSVSTNYNFYQTNNSPKALSRLEIYRMTKNQLNFAKGV